MTIKRLKPRASSLREFSVYHPRASTSRRHFLKALGISAAGATPGAHYLARAAIHQPLNMDFGSRVITFRLGSNIAWVLDARYFTGNPELTVKQSPDAIYIDLSNARLPGTDFSADLNCRLTKSATGWRMQLHLAQIPFDVDVPFEAWLAGLVPAECVINSCLIQGNIGEILTATVRGNLLASFSPTWDLTLSADEELVLSHHKINAQFHSKTARISLAQPQDASLLTEPSGQRTFILFERADEDWGSEQLLPESVPGTFKITGQPFDLLTVEASEKRSGRVDIGLQYEACGRGVSLEYSPGIAFRKDKETLFALGLRDAIVTETWGKRQQTSISARFDTEKTQLYASGCTLDLSDPQCIEQSPFLVVNRDGKLIEYLCAPILNTVSAFMPDALAAPMRPVEDTLLFFIDDAYAEAIPVADEVPRRVPRPSTQRSQQAPQKRPPPLPQPKTRTQPPAQVNQGRTTKQIQSHTARIVLPDLSVSVIRPEDFLHINFEFYNLQLVSGNRMHLVRKKAGKPAYIIARFPPQSIYEEALYEAATKSGSDPAKALPVQSRLSGDSRLVYSVPDTVKQVSYTLTALLNACGQYKLNVPRIALPPPPKLKAQLTQKIPAKIPGQSRRPEAHAPGSAMPAQPATFGKGHLDISKAKTIFAGPVKDKPPGRFETIIEMPYRLWLAPHAGAAWAHSAHPVVGHYGRVELWHTRLAVRRPNGQITEHDEHNRTLRAVWSPDYNQAAVPPHRNVPFRGSLDGRDRHEIVALTSDFRIPKYTPLPIKVKRLMLTSLGAWLNSRGAWNPPCDPKATLAPTGKKFTRKPISAITRLKSNPPQTNLKKCPPGTVPPCKPGAWLTVEEWRYRATMGRDNYVRVVYKGYLFPFGHRASLIKVTERKFRYVDEGRMKGKVAAYLHQRMYIVVRQPEFTYSTNERKNPFRKIIITTLETPNLDKPEDTDIESAQQSAFWPYVNKKPFQFHFVAEDWVGARSEFTAPLIFLDQAWAKDPSLVSLVISAYGKAGVQYRQRQWEGQDVAFAEAEHSNIAATTLSTKDITFDARALDCLSGDQPAFLPHVAKANVRIPAVEALTGGQTLAIKIAGIYAKLGFAGDNAVGQVFAEAVEASPLTFGADRSGGIATPNINIAGLSRKNGLIGGAPGNEAERSKELEQFGKGKFDPEKFFKGAASEAKILGGIPLFQLFDTSLDSKDAPRLVNNPVYKSGRLVAVETSLTWEPPVKPRVPTFIANKGGKTKFRLQATIINRFDGSEPESNITGSITNFAIDLIPEVLSFLEVEFATFNFSSNSGSSIDVTPGIRDVRFKGPLKYVGELAKYASSGSDSGGLNINVTPEAVSAGFGVAIPAVTSGVLTCQNIAFSGGISLPFSGDPMRARFAFCERDNPFQLTVYAFGGGGYASLAVGLDGVEQLEFAFEFGASVALDIGVASGGVEVMAGIYIGMTDEKCELSGYLRMGGELNVLAIVRVSIEFYMALTYDTDSNKTWGECRLIVDIEILFFSASVTLQVRREFSEPTYLPFRDMMSQQDWVEYCEAYA